MALLLLQKRHNCLKNNIDLNLRFSKSSEENLIQRYVNKRLHNQIYSVTANIIVAITLQFLNGNLLVLVVGQVFVHIIFYYDDH